MKIDFICPGAPKAATTTLYDVLQQHRGIALPNVAETSFFAFDDLYERGLSWFEEEYFSHIQKDRSVGDMSTSYMTFAELACPRIKASLGGDVKFVFLLRDPVRRAYSHYCMRRYNNVAEPESFDALVPRLLARAEGFDPAQLPRLAKGHSHVGDESMDDWRYLHYVRNGEYGRIIRTFLEHFPIENMQFTIFEEFVDDPGKHVAGILAFLGQERQEDMVLDLQSNKAGRIKYPALHKGLRWVASRRVVKRLTSVFGFANATRLYYYLKNSNRTAHTPPPLGPRSRDALYEYYHTDIRDVAALVGKDLSAWSPPDEAPTSS